jgi:hypothetical protein
MPINAPPPETERENPHRPPDPPPLLFEQFEGINTSTTRPGVDDKQANWLDGWMPIGPRKLRTLWDVGDALFTILGSGYQIIFFDFFNIGATPYMAVFASNGRVWWVNTNTGGTGIILPDGTILNPSRTSLGMCQYGSEDVIIVSDQENGYWVWDGSLLYGAGTLGPQVTITAGGTGYVNPIASASGGTGSGSQFTVTQVAGVVTEITVVVPGSGYSVGDTVTLNITDASGPGAGATATVILMPFGVSGTSVETYAGRVWVANGPLVEFTAPGSIFDFSTSNGGGNFSSTDSFLRVKFSSLKSTNGFLYLVADSSINYISGVTVSGTPPTTSFSNQNADPETGSPWPGAIITFSRNIILANAFGIHVSYGAAVTKISEPLDGVYNSVENFSGFLPSASKAIIFGRKIFMLLLPILDYVTGQQVNKLMMWDGKRWFTSEQSVPLLFIQSQEINSVLTAWGTDGSTIYPLFQQPGDGFTKTAQSKYWTAPGGYMMWKTAVRVWGMAEFYDPNPPEISVTVDTEKGSSVYNMAYDISEVVWYNDTGAVVTWYNQFGTEVPWYAIGSNLVVFKPTAVSNWGVVTGMTVYTDARDMALVSMMLQDEAYSYRG